MVQNGEKMKSKLILSLLLIFVLPVILFAQEKSAGGILYGPNWACMVSAPQGWSMDQESLAHYGIYGLFYEDGKKFGGNTPIIYINTQKLNDDSDTELEKFIAFDTNSYKNSGHKINEYQLKNIEEKKIFAYKISKENNYEICAYTRYKNCCFLVILTAHDEESITKNISNLEFIINHMAYMDKL